MGIERFHSLLSAIRAGYEVYGTIPEGYLVRRMTPSGWAMAVVVMSDEHNGAASSS